MSARYTIDDVAAACCAAGVSPELRDRIEAALEAREAASVDADKLFGFIEVRESPLIPPGRVVVYQDGKPVAQIVGLGATDTARPPQETG